jgi:hypothetical protein
MPDTTVKTRLVGSRLLGLAALISALPFITGFTKMTHHPDQAEIVTSDVTHFWQAFTDAANVPMAERAAIYQREYFDRASQGLKDFVAYRRVTPAAFTQHVETNRAYYIEVRPYISEVVEQKAAIKDGFRRLKALYPDIRIPQEAYFVVGPQRGAGMNSDHGIVMAAEMFATPPRTPYSYNKTYPYALPFIMVHEVIHYNQTFQPGDQATLLQYVISEGTADFIASLVLPPPNIRQYTEKWEYGCSHEAALAARFAAEQDTKSTGPWMYNNTPDTGWPPDMGYWLGYRIDQSFYARAHDKTQALRALLEVTDFKALLAASGYPATKLPCVPERPVPAGDSG